MKKLISGTAFVAGLAALVIAATALATPGSGALFTALAPVAQFGELNAKAKIGDWEAEIETKGLSDLHVTQIAIQPGGHGGWHSHPGPTFIVVKSGTATFYEAGDADCTPLVLPAGSGHFEQTGDAHIVRNEGTEALVFVVIHLVPTGAARRTDEPKPGNCSF
jgi:quercetin dioxygenase-like cupin family protein